MVIQLSWLAAVFFAVASYSVLHWYAAQEPLHSAAVLQVLHGYAQPAQYILPGIFLSGVLLSAILSFKRKKLYERITCSTVNNPLENLSKNEFKQLVAEYLRRLGYKVKKAGAGRGGADFIAKKSKEKLFVQCLQGKNDNVEVTLVEKLPEVMAAFGASPGLVVTTGAFAQDAVAYADANNIRLLDGGRLVNNFRAQVMDEGLPDMKPGGILQRVKWIGAGLVVVVLCCVALLFSEMGTSVRSTLFSRLDGFLSAHKAEQASENIEYTYTEEQVREAMEEVLNEKRRQQSKSTEIAGNAEAEIFLFEIELFGGGWVYTDNVKVTDDTVTYTTTSGVVVSLNREEVKTIKKIQPDKQE